MRVADLGEFGLIDRISRMVQGRSGPALRVDLGDDAAAWDTAAGTQLFTTDTLVAGVHFTPQTTPWADLGWKAMAVNVSDVAAMGGLPRYALITLGLPADFPVAAVNRFYQGALEAAKEYDFAIAGGDLVRSGAVFVTVALVGEADGPIITRAGARPGQRLGVTGPLGSSAGGLRAMQDGAEVAGAGVERLVHAHRRPRAHTAQGRVLAGAGVTTAMDVSDGLVDDLSKLCRAGGVSAKIDAHRLPMDPALTQCFPAGHRALALTGGEDYVLLFAADPTTMDALLPKLGAGAAIIGRVEGGEPGRVRVVDETGQDVALPSGGWDHYR